MGYSNDLRVRVIQVVEGGATARAAARQFVIGDSTAIRWAKQWRETGSVEVWSQGGCPARDVLDSNLTSLSRGARALLRPLQARRNDSNDITAPYAQSASRVP
jgi:transposase-like protein